MMKIRQTTKYENVSPDPLGDHHDLTNRSADSRDY